MIKFILPALVIFLIILFWEKISEMIYKKFNLKLIISNNLSSLIICFFNYLIIYISTLNPSSTIFQIKLIAISIIFYNVAYMLLFKFYKSNLISKK